MTKFQMMRIYDWDNPPEEALNSNIILYSDDVAGGINTDSMGLYLEIPDTTWYSRIMIIFSHYGTIHIRTRNGMGIWQPPVKLAFDNQITTPGSNVYIGIPNNPKEGDISISK